MNLPTREPGFTARPAMWKIAAAGLAAAVVVAGLSAMQLYVSWQARGYDAAFGELFRAELVEWTLWAAVAPAILALDIRAGFGRDGVHVLPFTVHVSFGLAFLAVHNLVMASIAPDAGADFAQYFWQRFVIKLPGGVLTYTLVLGGFWVARLYAAYHRRLVEGARLEAELAGAEFANLSARLHPHFLFNSLHSIGHLVREVETRRAVDALAELGELLRRSLDRAGEPESTLREELEFLRRYLHIQRLRFGDRLEVREDVDPDALDALVPTLLLQPLVENAIRHGLELDKEAGLVAIAARRDARSVVITVADNGSGFVEAPERTPEGVGLGSTRDRLALLYGADAVLAVGATGEFSTQVTVRLPFHTMPVA